MESTSKGYSDLDANVRDTEGDDSDSNAESETDSESETEGDDDDIATKSPPNSQQKSEAYTEFLQFLELGCSGSPVECYPLVLVVLAGIPKSVWFIVYILPSN